MINVETLDLLLAIAEGELIEEIIVALLASPTIAVFFEKFPRLKKAVSEDLPQWRAQLKHRLQEGEVPRELADEVFGYQQTQMLTPTQLSQKIPALLQFLEDVHSPFLPEAKKCLTEESVITPARYSLFLQRWRLSLVQQGTSLNQQILEDERDKLLADIQARMALSGELDSALAENQTAAGKLWDMSQSSLRKGDNAAIIRYSQFLSSQPELQALAEQLGRSRAAKSVPRETAPSEPWRMLVREPASVPEQVEGLHQSDDILRLLPPELAVLGISELEYEFYRKLVEKQLLTYRLQGDNWREKITERPVAHKDFDIQPRGPFIVCVDTSGSMGGFNEQCAKAFCLALMRIALADNRRCFIEMFSSEVIHYELTGQDGLDQAIRFLSQRFQGGTDLAQCFRSVIHRMQQREGHDADTVIISDFIAQRLPDDIISMVKTLQHQQQNRFHALAMSAYGKPGILRIFDHVWRFDTGLKSRIQRRFRR